MQKIENIEIKNFKSIRHQKIEGCKRINVFIGEPNVGKSNILEALSIPSYLNNSDLPSFKNFCRYKELIDIFSDGDKQKDAVISTDEYVFSLRFLDKNQVDFIIINRIHYIENAIEQEGLKNFRIHKDGRVEVLTTKKLSNESLKIKKYQFQDNTSMQKNNPKELDFPFGSNLAEIIRHNSGLRKDCGELFANYSLKLVFDENENIIIQKQLDEFTAFQFSFSQIAETLQRLIFHKAAIATNQNSVLLFEEPEAHMYPPYISKFTSDVINDENNNQFFLATHSPFVLNDFMENAKEDLAIYLVDYKKETGETIISKMSDEEMHEAYQFGYDFFLNIKQFLPQH